MLLEQPYESKTITHINETELSYLVNRYIIESYSYMIQSKKITPEVFERNGKSLKAVYLFGLSDVENDIIDLDFPLINEEKGWICFDLRKYVTVDKQQGTFEYKRSSDLNFVNLRNKLTGLWGVDFINDQYLFSLPRRVFAQWLSGLISSKFGLDMQEKSDLEILSFIYYYRMFTNEVNREEEFVKLTLAMKDTFYTENMLRTVFDRCPNMNTLEDFCSVLEEVTGNVRLKGFSVAILYRLTQASWMGGDSRKNIALALEFPPIWIAMCYSSLESNFYNKTPIGSRMVTLSKRGEGEAFVKSVNELLQNIKEG